MNIYISNLDTNFKDDDLKNLFASHGDVATAEVVIDHFTNRSRGFGFVEMPDADAATKAIETLNNSTFGDKVIEVKEAQPKENHKGSYRVGNGVVKEYRFRKN